MIKKIKIAVIAVAFCAVFLVGSILFEVLAKKLVENSEREKETLPHREFTDNQQIHASNKFGEILYEDEKMICYDDRVVMKYTALQDNSKKVCEKVAGILNECSKLENVYVMPMPNHILINDGMSEGQEAYKQYIESLKEQMPEKGVVVDALANLKSHESEYIYFKTSDFWTARGAYCGMEVLGRAMGLDVIPLNKYWEYTYNSFAGELILYDKIKEIEKTSSFMDYVYYYLLPGSDNRVEVYEEEEGELISYKKPLITPSYRNIGMFIGSGYSKAIVEGESYDGKNNGEYVLMVCDDAGKVLAPYLKDYYDGIYVVSIMRNENFISEINEIVDKYNITDMVYVQSSITMGDAGYSKALNPFCKENTNN